MRARAQRRLDLVVYGATSFVGRILVAHLVARHGSDGDLRWAIAGRDRARLDRVAAETGADVERIIADATDPRALAELAAETRVVVSTVGPYALHGSELVRAVVDAGTDYCDLTGETQWIRRMIDAHEDRARESGARIIHACGFDSIPSDLGVWFTQQRARERFGQPCDRIGMRLAGMRGGASGGTIASMVNLVAEAAGDAEVRRILADPYALAPVGERSGVDQPDITGPTRDALSGQWVAPFVMAAINTRIVLATNVRLGHPWGRDFRYDEGMLMGSGPLGLAKAGGLSAGLLAALGVTAVGPLRGLLAARLLPKPGTGPSVESQRKGFFELRFFGRTPDGEHIATRVTGDRDPGYGSTAKMLGETAAALVELQPEALPGGFWTPASTFGDELVSRLEAHAGLRFETCG